MYVFEEQLGQLLDMVQNFLHVVLLLTDPAHLIGYELHKRESEECQKQFKITPSCQMLLFSIQPDSYIIKEIRGSVRRASL